MRNVCYFSTAVLLFSTVLFSCKVSVPPAPLQAEEAIEKSDTTVVLEVEPKVEPKIYRGERTLRFKLSHTKLDVRFDWKKQHVLGNATLTLEPYFYAQSHVLLDAKGFKIHEITRVSGDSIQALQYDYDGKMIDIDLERKYLRGQKLNLNIKYTARPNEINDADSVTNDRKGLYFINPSGSESGKPQQIWTQGETNSNSRWFPTIDAPNQKTTQEIYITVQDRFKTLSNGTLVFSKSNLDSTRTDYWKMDQPHAPYLIMLAVGDFTVVEDEWQGKKVDYYVEPAYRKYAKAIFGNTPEMMGYFSELLNYPYPWDKYSQIVVRDFVSGAMENTTASVFMEDLLVNSRELIDYNWDDIIAHELFHHWFGDLVTCESWSNLPLNESFASYGEYLWKSHKYGKNEASYFLYDELDSYLSEAEYKKEDLIRFYYDGSEDMFDNHSYAKGGLVLHLLRNQVGDEAFFKSLEYYLKNHAYGKAEIHELRLAFEHIAGEDLNWFFNQWFLSAGHPNLHIGEEYDSESQKLIIKVRQDQDLDISPIYQLPLSVDIWENDQKAQYNIEINKPYQEFEFESKRKPELVMVDSDYLLLGEKIHEKSMNQFQFQYQHYPENIRARLESIEYFKDHPTDSISKIMAGEALDDSFRVIREDALQFFEADTTGLFFDHEKQIKSMATNDSNPLVKATAISVLATKNLKKYVDVYKANLYDSSYFVAGQALYAYLQSGEEDTEVVLKHFSTEVNFNIASSIADYYVQHHDHSQYSWFKDKLAHYSGSDLWYFIKLFGMYLLTAPEGQVKDGIATLESIAMSHYQFYNRYSSYQSLELLSDVEGVTGILEKIKENENDPRVLESID